MYQNLVFDGSATWQSGQERPKYAVMPLATDAKATPPYFGALPETLCTKHRPASRDTLSVDSPLVRHLEPTDYEQIIAVIDEWWGGRRMTDMLPKLFFVHFRNTSFVAEFEGNIVGFLVGFTSQTQPEEAYIHFVGVHPLFRQLGLGKLLYVEFFAAVLPLGCHTVSCVTSPVNRSSIAFHKKMGFTAEKAARTVDGIPVFADYDGKGEDRVLFTKILSSEDANHA